MTRPDFRIRIQPSLWGRRVEVVVEPGRMDQPLKTFADHGEAAAFAEQLGKARGWQVHDTIRPRKGR